MEPGNFASENKTEQTGLPENGQEQVQVQDQVQDQGQAPQDMPPANAPATSDPLTADAAGTPGKKNRKPIMIGAAAAAVVIAAALLAIFFTSILSDDKSDVAKGFGLLAADINDDSLPSLKNYLGSEQFEDQTAFAFEVNLNLEKLPSEMEDFSIFEGSGIQYLIAMDETAKTMRGKANIKFGTLFSVGAAATWKDGKIYVEAPGFFKGSIALNADNIKEQYDNSVFADYLGIDIPEEFSLDPFAVDRGSTQQEAADHFSENLILASKPSWTQLWEETTVTKSKEKKDFEIGGQTLTARDYALTVPKEAYLEALSVLKNFLEEDESSRPMFELLSKQANLLTISSSTTAYEARNQENMTSADDIRNAFSTALDDYMESVSQLPQDMAIHIWLLKDGRIAAINAADLPGSQPGTTLFANVSMSGETRLCDNTQVSLTSSKTPSPLEMSFVREANETRNALTATLNSPDENGEGEAATITYFGSLDTADGSYVLSLVLDDGYDPVSLSLDGSFAGVTPGQSYTINLDSLVLEYDGDTAGFSGDMRRQPLDGPIGEPAAVSYELFRMTDDDLTSLILEIYQKAASQFSFLM